MTIEERLDTLVLVTGATGFIGAHCVSQLLQLGYKVKAGVRSNEKAQRLRSCFGDDIQDNLSFAVIHDITNQDDMDKAVAGCNGVIHLASPFTYNVKDYRKELLVPAVLGTLTVLKAANKEPKVKRVIITSSFAAVFDADKGLQPGVVLTEEDWSPLTWEDGEKTNNPAVAYRVSKTVAEKAAWSYIEDEEPAFDISVICPPMVLGPLASVHILDTPENLNFSSQLLWQLLDGQLKEIPPTKGPVWADVRDIALAHVRAFEKPEASNQRFLVSAGDYDYQEIADIMRENLSPKYVEKIVIGEPGFRLTGTHYTTDSSKAEKVLELTFRPLKETVLDFSLQMLSIKKNACLS